MLIKVSIKLELFQQYSDAVGCGGLKFFHFFNNLRLLMNSCERNHYCSAGCSNGCNFTDGFYFFLNVEL